MLPLDLQAIDRRTPSGSYFMILSISVFAGNILVSQSYVLSILIIFVFMP